MSQNQNLRIKINCECKSTLDLSKIASPSPNHRHFLISYGGAGVCLVTPGTCTKIVNITTKPELQSLLAKKLQKCKCVSDCLPRIKIFHSIGRGKKKQEKKVVLRCGRARPLLRSIQYSAKEYESSLRQN